MILTAAKYTALYWFCLQVFDEVFHRLNWATRFICRMKPRYQDKDLFQELIGLKMNSFFHTRKITKIKKHDFTK